MLLFLLVLASLHLLVATEDLVYAIELPSNETQEAVLECNGVSPDLAWLVDGAETDGSSTEASATGYKATYALGTEEGVYSCDGIQIHAVKYSPGHHLPQEDREDELWLNTKVSCIGFNDTATVFVNNEGGNTTVFYKVQDSPEPSPIYTFRQYLIKETMNVELCNNTQDFELVVATPPTLDISYNSTRKLVTCTSTDELNRCNLTLSSAGKVRAHTEANTISANNTERLDKVTCRTVCMTTSNRTIAVTKTRDERNYDPNAGAPSIPVTLAIVFGVLLVFAVVGFVAYKRCGSRPTHQPLTDEDVQNYEMEEEQAARSDNEQ